MYISSEGRPQEKRKKNMKTTKNTKVAAPCPKSAGIEMAKNFYIVNDIVHMVKSEDEDWEYFAIEFKYNFAEDLFPKEIRTKWNSLKRDAIKIAKIEAMFYPSPDEEAEVEELKESFKNDIYDFAQEPFFKDSEYDWKSVSVLTYGFTPFWEK